MATRVHMHRRRLRSRGRKRSREGAVMLVVLLILLVATASAAVSVSNTQTELQAAGNERVAMQTRYVAEAGLSNTIAWLEILALRDPERYKATFDTWQSTPPTMEFYAEPEFPPASPDSPIHMNGRITMGSQMNLHVNAASEVPALSNAAAYSSSGGTGGAGGTSTAGSGGTGGGSSSDTTGSFGPSQGFGLPAGGFVVDLTDCREPPGAIVAGSNANKANGSSKSTSFYCVLTARGRLEPLGGSRLETWKLGSSGKTFQQSVDSSAHDARATMITPEMLFPN